MNEHHIISIGLLLWFMGWVLLAAAQFLVFTAVAYKRIER
jgi:hypothetical protein